MTLVTVFAEKFARSWPERDRPLRDSDRATVVEIGEALEQRYETDAHFAAYASPNGYRLNRDALVTGVTVELAAVVFDIDCPETHGSSEPAPESWRRPLREKMCALFDAHGAGFYYETKGGARLVYRQEESTIIESADDAREWSQSYAVLIAYLARRFDLHADPACSDWQRLFRLPRATRTLGAQPENRPTYGDPARIANLLVDASAEDVATAKRSTTAFRQPKPHDASSPVATGDGLFYAALRLRGHLGRPAPRGGAICLCPNRHEHTTNTDWSDATIVVPPAPGTELGLIVCLHAHCRDRFTVQQWLRMFTDAELDAARDLAGIKRRDRSAA